VFGEECLLANAVLRDRKGSTVRTDDGVPLRFGDGLRSETFSNSKVTTSTRLANARTASRSSYDALISSSAI
jgi:hypothetical protein